MNLDLYMDQIEKYLAGDLSESETAAFEHEIATNAALRRAVDLYRLSTETVEIAVEDDLRHQFRQWSEESKNKSSFVGGARIVGFRRFILAAAAAAGVLLLIGFFGLNFARNNYSDTALATEFYEMPAVSGFRNGSGDQTLESGLAAIDAGNWVAAADFFGSIPGNDPRFAEAQLLFGHVQMQLKNYEAAAIAFGKVIETGDTRFAEKAEWNLLLAWLSDDNPSTDYTPTLSKITAETDHSYHRQAVELQKKLNGFWHSLAH